jgi:thioredoxin reductase (NADPH)
VPGEDLPHVSHYFTEPHVGFRRSVVVVGGKNSAAEAALDLYRAGSRVTIVHRQAALGASIKYWLKPDIENRIREGAIAARFDTRVLEIRPASVVVECQGVAEEIPADLVFLLTGYRPDLDLLTRAGVTIVPGVEAPCHDPGTFETNVRGLFVAGAVVAGAESGKIFIENGRFHGQRVIEVIRERLGS